MMGLLSKFKGYMKIDPDTFRGMFFKITCHNKPDHIELIFERDNFENFFLKNSGVSDYFNKSDVRLIYPTDLDMKFVIYLKDFKHDEDEKFKITDLIAETYAEWLNDNMPKYGFDITRIQSTACVKIGDKIEQRSLIHYLDNVYSEMDYEKEQEGI